jgi:hypothetical protein
MGFIKRLLSIGSKNKKKQQRREHASTPPSVVLRVDQMGDVRNEAEEDAQSMADQLLRSSSARFKVVAESDYNDLPPLRMWHAPCANIRLTIISQRTPSTTSCDLPRPPAPVPALQAAASVNGDRILIRSRSTDVNSIPQPQFLIPSGSLMTTMTTTIPRPLGLDELQIPPRMARIS